MTASLEKAPPQISAIVCTWNNARILENTLKYLMNQALPPEIKYEVVIVDNNSTDDTAAVAHKFTSKPNSIFRYVLEGTQGISVAFNRGIAEARAEIVALINDDALADPNWLRELWKVYLLEPKAVCVGGKSVLQFPPGPLPSWYSDRIAGYLAARDLPYGQAKGPKDFPYGVNISFRKSVVQQHGGFYPVFSIRPLFGARPQTRIVEQGNETHLCLRLLMNGETIIFQPAALVTHVVPEGRLRKEYFLKFTTSNGYLDVILENKGQVGVSTYSQLDKYARRLYRRWRQFRRNRASMSEAESFAERLAFRTMWASVRYCLWAKRQLIPMGRSLAQSVSM